MEKADVVHYLVKKKDAIEKAQTNAKTKSEMCSKEIEVLDYAIKTIKGV